jgi:hypothetical protein
MGRHDSNINDTLQIVILSVAFFTVTMSVLAPNELGWNLKPSYKHYFEKVVPLP